MATTKRKDSNNRVLKEGEYQRSNGTYEFKWRNKRGKRFSLSAKTLDELREKEVEALRDALDGVTTSNNNLTINDLYDLWLQLKRGLKANTLSNYRYMYEQYVKPHFGNSKLKELKRSDVRAFYNNLVDEKHIKVNTLDCVHSVLHQVLELAVEDEYLRYNPADNALKELKKAHKNESEKRHALTLAQQNLFEDYLWRNNKARRWYPIFVTMLWTGMRVGEITGLRWCDVDFEENTISVNHTLIYFSEGGRRGKAKFAINTTKTKAGDRIIPMLPKVREALLMEKKYQEDIDVQCEAVIDGYTDFIFVNRFGNTQHQGTLNKALYRIIRDCNYEVMDKHPDSENVVLLPNFSNHNLRHTFATRMCEAGVNLKAMQDVLGHADAETTMDIYAEATKDLKVSELKSFAEFFEDQKKAQITLLRA